MKAIFFVFSCLFPLISYSQNTYKIDGNKMEKGIMSTTPCRDINYLDDGIEVVYSFNGINIYPDPIYKNASFVKISGFGVTENEGEPSVPVHWDCFVVPRGADVHVTITDSTSITLPLELAPARKKLSDNNYEGYDSTNVLPIVPYLGYHPLQNLVGVESYNYHNYDIYRVCVTPLKYNYAEKKVILNSQLKYHITWNGYDKNACVIRGKAFSDSDVFLNNCCLNYNIEETERNSTQLVLTDYLIVTHPNFIEAAEKLSKWKKLMGYNVKITSKSGWTSNTVKDSITYYYNLLGNLEYLLIVGDNDFVPSNNHGYITDYEYGCMSGNVNGISEIRRGRLPASSLDEALIMVDKIIGYEYNPPQDESFYETGINCAYFQDEYDYGHNENGGYDGIETRRFVKTSEEIRDYMILQGKDVLRIYDANALSNPMRWNNDLYSFGDSIPTELRRPTFMWNGNYLDIISNINSGAFYVCHRDHGGVDRWGDPTIFNSHISSLSNGNKLPVVFSINCSTGKFDESSDCFAETFIKNPNGGCVAIFAASNETWSGTNDALVEGMFNSIWPYPGLIPVFPNKPNNYTYQSIPLYKLGYILDNGFMKMEETYGSSVLTRKLFHCFGDPSMQIITEKPTIFSSASVSRMPLQIQAQTGEGSAYITFYDCSNNLMLCYYTNSIVFSNPSFDLNNTIVCISSHNKIPYIDNNSTLYLQNETINSNRVINSSNVMIGRDVSPLKPYGPVVIQNGNTTINANMVEIKNDMWVKVGAKFKINNNE